jgi:hypothetical protein
MVGMKLTCFGENESKVHMIGQGSGQALASDSEPTIDKRRELPAEHKDSFLHADFHESGRFLA